MYHVAHFHLKGVDLASKTEKCDSHTVINDKFEEVINSPGAINILLRSVMWTFNFSDLFFLRRKVRKPVERAHKSDNVWMWNGGSFREKYVLFPAGFSP
jgi:hypothetical protein